MNKPNLQERENGNDKWKYGGILHIYVVNKGMVNLSHSIGDLCQKYVINGDWNLANTGNYTVTCKARIEITKCSNPGENTMEYHVEGTLEKTKTIGNRVITNEWRIRVKGNDARKVWDSIEKYYSCRLKLMNKQFKEFFDPKDPQLKEINALLKEFKDWSTRNIIEYMIRRYGDSDLRLKEFSKESMDLELENFLKNLKKTRC